MGGLEEVRIYSVGLSNDKIAEIAFGGGGGPTDPGFAITSIERNADDSVTLTWPAEDGKTYSVGYSANLVDGFTEIATGLTEGTFTDDDAARVGLPEGYYRVGTAVEEGE